MPVSEGFSRIEKLLLFLTLFVVLGLGTAHLQAFDTFWQLQSGKHILETGSFIYTDIFSLAAEAPRHEHCWLHDILLYLAYALAGYEGLSLLKGTLIAATFAALLAAARGRGASLLAILFISLPAFLQTPWLWRARPQLWTFLFFALFVWILERHRRTGDRIVFCLFPLMLLWANLHAGSILAFPILAAYLAGEAIDHGLKRSRLPRGGLKKLSLLLPLLLAAAFATPYGFKLLATLVHSPKLGPSDGVTGRFNIDWQATTFADLPNFYYAAVIAAFFLFLGRKRLRCSDLFLLAGLALMGLKLARHTPFYFFAMAAILPAYVDAAFAPWATKLGKTALTTLKPIALVAALAWASIFVRDTYLRQGFFQAGLKAWYYPQEAAAFVKQQRLPGNLFNSYEWGGYLMWALYPEYRVFWDGRQDSSRMYALGLKVQDGEPEWQQILDDFEVRTILVKPLSVDVGARFRILDRMRESPFWALVYTDDHSLVFVRQDAVDPQWLQKYRQPKERIDQVIISEGTLMLNEFGTNRYRVYWEMFRIHFARREYGLALQSLERFKRAAPKMQREERIVGHYDQLLRKMLGSSERSLTR